MDSSDEQRIMKKIERDKRERFATFMLTGVVPAIPMPPPESVKTAGYNPPPYSTQDTHHGANPSQSTIITVPEIIENSKEAGLETVMEFTDKTLRHRFIRKVFGILMSQFVITGLIILGCMQIPDTGVSLIKEHFFQFFGPPFIIFFVALVCISCCVGPRRRVPWNYMFLLLLTLSLSFIVGMFTAFFKGPEVLFAVGITFTVFLGLTLFAFQTKYDFTTLTGSSLIIGIALLILGISLFTTSFDHSRLVYVTLGVVIMSICFVWDIQLIIGGNHRYSFSAEDYVFAAAVLYIDVMYIFLRILRCVGTVLR